MSKAYFVILHQKTSIMKIGFDNEKYQKIQSEHIKERISQFDGKLYLELGGKLFDDHHASRVLPGFMPDSKLRMFQKLSDSIEIVIVISATDIEKNKKRADLGITYDEDVLRLRGEFENRGFMVGSVVITHYNGQPAATAFRQRLEREGIKTYYHYLIEGYPHNVSLIASDEGFGQNDYVETERPLLGVQYRMNEHIMKFSSDWFYGGKVQTAPEVKNRGILDYDEPMQWIDTSLTGAKEEFVGESFGRINKQEAQLTIDTLRSYYAKIGRTRALDERIDVGVISPYRAQVQYLRQLIRRDDELRPLRRLITVNTVDGFQGQERDVIIISLVRANDDGQIGFLSDLRRMNVAITRARMKLIILGNAATMTKHGFYKKLFQFCGQDDETLTEE